jgi:predicted anti-sigma-YlaC factor YlaD
MNHLRPEECVDAVDDTLAAERQAHLASCRECRAEVSRIASLLGRVREVTVAEPSPLFWGALSARVRGAIAGERVPRREFRWFEWPVLAPLGTLAVLVLGLVWAVSQGPGELRHTQVAVSPELFELAGEAAEIETPWELMAALVQDVDFDAADHQVVIVPGSADGAAGQLTAAEHQELLRLLREELQGAGG